VFLHVLFLALQLPSKLVLICLVLTLVLKSMVLLVVGQLHKLLVLLYPTIILEF